MTALADTTSLDAPKFEDPRRSPSAGGGWFSRLTADDLTPDVTPLVASPAQAAHEAAIYFCALTGTAYGTPIPDAQPDGPLSRADIVRATIRDAAGVHHDRIATAPFRSRRPCAVSRGAGPVRPCSAANRAAGHQHEWSGAQVREGGGRSICWSSAVHIM
ncbi:hypothetical protein [Streptomyces sp. NPDC058620]|uniref:hypothetical protein n=1 Tax=Streptomyces sp. NPDC058620 TaxID=3346560 RepID=UPI00365196CA